MNYITLTASSIRHTMVMAAICATLMCLPVAGLLALFAYAVLGISFHSFLTFDGALNNVAGLLAWWSLAFLIALPYAAFAMPWSPTAISPPGP
jgi:hypothetical protein